MLDAYGRRIHYLRLSVTGQCNLRCRYCMPSVALPCGERAADAGRAAPPCRPVGPLRHRHGAHHRRGTAGAPRGRASGGGAQSRARHPESRPDHQRGTAGRTAASPAGRRAGQRERQPGHPLAGGVCPHHFPGCAARCAGRHPCRAGKRAAPQTELRPQPGVNEVGTAGRAGGRVPAAGAVHRDDAHRLWGRAARPVRAGGAGPAEAPLAGACPLAPEQSAALGDGPAVYYSAPGWPGSIGLIAAVHGKFCASCNRVRLTSQGFLRLCLASEAGCDLRALLWGGASDEELLAAIAAAIRAKPREHHFEAARDLPVSRECTASEDRYHGKAFWPSAPAPGGAPSRPRWRAPF